MEKFLFECVDCKTSYTVEKIIYLCPACERLNQPGVPPKGVLKTVFQYDHIRSLAPKESLFDYLADRHFLPLMPIRDMNSWPKLRVGDTPLYKVERWISGEVDKGKSGQGSRGTGEQADKLASGEEIGFDLFLKDDSQNPTFSFKDRASALVSAWARENGMETLIAASTGNAGSSLAGICASQGQRSVIVVPSAAPLAKLTQIMMYGAILVPVKGNYDDAFDLSIRISEKYGFYNRNTAFNPLTIEGKKTVSFEIFRQLDRQVPDRIYIPVGDGVIYTGVCKGFEDLMQLGIIDRIPVLVAVQAEGSSNFIRNLNSNAFISAPSRTVADSISVDVPRNFRMASACLEQYQGASVIVSDQEILDASIHLSRLTGIFAEPAAAAAFAGMLKDSRQGLIPAGSKNVVLLTGSGLKVLAAVQQSINIPDAVEPTILSAENIIGKHFSPLS